MKILPLKDISWGLCIYFNYVITVLFPCFSLLLGCFGISFRVCSIFIAIPLEYFHLLRVFWFWDTDKCTLSGVKD